MYMDLINEEVNGIDLDEENEEKEVIPIDVETHIGSEYSDESEIIIELHKKINGITNKKELKEVLSEIKDRFGITNEQLVIYAHEKYVEKLLAICMCKIVENDNLKCTIKINKEVFNTLNVESLFYESTKITTKFNFAYKSSTLFITLLKANLERNYIYYIEELLEAIYKQKFGA